ncbi:MAG: ammonium transporter [Deltaproteobacteria bacterium]|nr:ammonium transporter [Deltaproteobacteria bacterium]MBW2412906.1 ammonium transporter [Deltaproteobacteria bacterium]
MRTVLTLTGLAALLIGAPGAALADDGVTPAMFTVNNLWILIAAGLVFIMHLGFATLESGLTRAKNTTNILFKNTFIVCAGIVTYALVGFNLMYPGDFNGFIGCGAGCFGLFPSEADLTVAYADGAYTYWSDFLFQAMFAATAATIVSGAVAERVKLNSFMVFSVLYVAFGYTIMGSWKWGGGFLDSAGFYDFAGSTLVHSVGGWAALVGAFMLGPRIGKYVKGRLHPIPGSNLPGATIGVFLLWLGWFGFNGGSVLSADPAAVSLTLVMTCLAAAAGGLAAMLTSSFLTSKPDLSMALNGILAGLVGITAGADQMAMGSAIAIGSIAGVIVVFSVLFFDRIKIDDPVGAISVHLVCGIWGTLAVGIFGAMAGVGQLMVQLYGVAVYGAGSIVISGVLFAVIRAVMGLRVTEEEELEGLDLAEHGQHAYDLATGTGASIFDEITGGGRVRAPSGEATAQLAGSNS